MTKKNDIPDGLKDAFKALDKLNEDSALLSENSLSVVNEYIDTGSMALNAIISGSLYKGVPKGRIIGLAGPTGSGKTLILNKIIANAQKKDPNVWGVVWDSENAYNSHMAINVGANPNKIKVNPVATVEECRNQIVTFLDKIVTDPSLYGKIIIGIDSLGNLASTKEIADAVQGKDAVDMGTRAKALKSMMRVLTYKCAKTNTTLLFLNHLYDDPACMFPSLIKNQSGGKGLLYLASVLIQLAVTQEKIELNDSDEFIPMTNKIKGVNLRALTVKNRFIPQMLQTSMYLNFRTGLYKYSGLLEMAEAYNIIHKEGNSYVSTLTNERLGFKKAFRNDDEIWETHILPELEKVIQKNLMYSSEANELTKEVDELSDELSDGKNTIKKD